MVTLSENTVDSTWNSLYYEIFKCQVASFIGTNQKKGSFKDLAYETLITF